MAKKLKINFQQTQTIREAFADFLLQKKALGSISFCFIDKTAFVHYSMKKNANRVTYF